MLGNIVCSSRLSQAHVENGIVGAVNYYDSRVAYQNKIDVRDYLRCAIEDINECCLSSCRSSDIINTDHVN
jgi:hypothetical protein